MNLSKNEPLPPLPKLELGRYYHYKHPDELYEVLGVSRHTETLEPLVVYRALYEKPNREFGALWVRPYEMFTGTVVCDGKQMNRFEKLKS